MIGERSVLLCTEGTYPFETGGVSIWCDILCRELAEVDFALHAISAMPETPLRYQPPANVRSVVQIPLWGQAEPTELFRPELSGRALRRRRRSTTSRVVQTEFVPLLEHLLEGVWSPCADVAEQGAVLHSIWRYFDERDWTATWKSREAWYAFAAAACRSYEEAHDRFLPHEQPTVFDLTSALRWLARLLLPLNVPLPETDVVHATIAASAGLAGVIAKRERSTPFVLTEHGVSIRERYIAVSGSSFTPFGRRFLTQLSVLISRLVYAHADVVAPVCGANRPWEIAFGVPPERVEVIPNGIDPDVYVPRPKPFGTRGRPTVVAATRVMPLKDIETMIRSAALVREGIPDVRYVLYGSLDADPAYTSRCRTLIAELELTRSFELAGHHSNPVELYAEGDLSILSSISEVFPYTVLESMACARPVVATDVGGIREMVEGCGVVAPPRDAEALGEGVSILLRNEALKLELGRRARERVLARYRLSTSLDAYRTLYVGASLGLYESLAAQRLDDAGIEEAAHR